MSAPTAKRHKRSVLQRVGSALRGQRGWLHLADYHVGDVESDQPVRIAATATGNIVAPKVVVAGLLYGLIVAEEVVVERGGQVWGDVFAGRVQLEQGGKVHGWLSTLNESSFHTLRDGDSSLQEAVSLLRAELPPQQENGGAVESEMRSALREYMLRRLQMEAATALAARAELEESFEERIKEVAGEIIAEAALLREQVAINERALADLQGKAQELESVLEQRESQTTQQARELATVRELLARRTAAQEELASALEQQQEEMARLQQGRGQFEGRLQEASEQVEQLRGRLEGLEVALQTSVQHAAEQGEALLRWQELAEVTEKRAAGLTKELEETEARVAESAAMVERVRQQRERLQAQWEAANAEAAGLREQVAEGELATIRLLQQRAEAEERLEAAARRLEAAEQAVAAGRSGAATQPPPQLLAAQERLAEAEVSRMHLDLARARIKELEEQAAQGAATGEPDGLQAARTVISTLRREIAGLRQAQADKQAQIDKWKEQIGRLTELLQEAGRKVRQTAPLEEAGAALARLPRENASLAEELMRRQLRLEASEAEIGHYVEAMEQQSGRLAELHAVVVERDLALQHYRATADDQARQLLKMQQAATRRIQRLEAELTASNRHLQELSARPEGRERLLKRDEPEA